MASITSDDAIRVAVSALLDANREVAAVLNGRMAFRDIGAFTTFPFLAIGHTREHAPSSSHVETHIVTVHLWLRPGEAETAQELMQTIQRALEHDPLRIPGAIVRSFRHEASSVRLAPELDALHATLRYRLKLSRKRRSGQASEPRQGTNAA